MRDEPKYAFTFDFDAARRMWKLFGGFTPLDFRHNQKYDEIRCHK